ncbi:hypothetical protein [Halobellus sp. GM3]|uniref:hypothetical protein n=1 Tax=Halobellus sp. GM3 TaxID=3458410 RepID=UPI00403DCA7B
MSKTCRPTPSVSDSEWTVRQVVPRCDWDAVVETCPACGDAVDLRDPYVQVELDRERTPDRSVKLTHERRLLSFCGEACAAQWLDGSTARSDETADR